MITDLGTLPGGDEGSVASGINERGDIVGNSTSFGRQLAVVWTNGQIINLGTLPGDVNSLAVAINNRGEIVGVSCRVSCHAVLWSPRDH